jgi:serine/threonine-protein kinase
VLAGRYELGQKLGSGGMATVYEAHDKLLDRSVAVKLLRSDALSEHTARQRFSAEARAAASLTHPHAVAVYDVNSGDEQPFIVMELVRGRTLEDVLNDTGRLDDSQAIAVGSQVLAALHAAHRRGLVHRDDEARRAARGQAGRLRHREGRHGRHRRSDHGRPGHRHTEVPVTRTGQG